MAVCWGRWWGCLDFGSCHSLLLLPTEKEESKRTRWGGKERETRRDSEEEKQEGEQRRPKDNEKEGDKE